MHLIKGQKFILFILILCFATPFNAQAAKLSLFQQQIKNCQVDVDTLEKIKNIKSLYKAIDKKYLLGSEKTLAREILYKMRSENRKLKVVNDQVSVFSIADDESLVPINNEARQKMKTVNGQVSQLTLNATIDSDWSKTKENRETGLVLEVTRNADQITQIKIMRDGSLKILECQSAAASEFCLCYSAAENSVK